MSRAFTRRKSQLMSHRLYRTYLWNVIRDKNGKIYGPKFYRDKLEYHKSWIESDPGRSNIRLRNSGLCSYCKTKLSDENRSEDHVCGRELDQVQFMIPCCNLCNSSKGKKDLIEWWCDFKGYDILKLNQDVLSIYVRAKYRILKKHEQLNENTPEIHTSIIKQLEVPIFVK